MASADKNARTYEMWWEATHAQATADEHGKKAPIYGRGIWLFCTAHRDGEKSQRRSLHITQQAGAHCFAGCTRTTNGYLQVLDRYVPKDIQAKHFTPGDGTAGQPHGHLAAVPPRTAPTPPPAPQQPAAAPQQPTNVTVMPQRQTAQRAEGNFKLVQQYEYRRPDGILQAIKARLEEPVTRKKSFRWRHPEDVHPLTGEPQWKGLREGEMRDMPLWGAEKVASWPVSEPVWFAEGEKDTQALRDNGLKAICHGGGAGTIDFGTSLEVLRGRRVVLWPDNDEQGRQYMRTVAARLRTLGCSVSVVSPPMLLAEKEGAWDYFNKRGGTVEALHGDVLIEPTLTYMGRDTLVVRMPVQAEDGTVLTPVEFRFGEMEKSNLKLAAELTVQLVGKPEAPEYVQRIDMLSSSGQRDARLDLEKLYKRGYGDYPWVHLLNRAYTMARRGFVNRDRSVDIFDIDYSDDSDLFLVDDILPYREPTILFGDGSSTKSFSAFDVALSVIFGRPFAGHKVNQQGPVLVLDYETNEQNFRRRISRLFEGHQVPVMPTLMHYWPGYGTPLPDMVDGLRKKIEEEGIVLLIVDSAGYACGGEPEKADVAIRMMNSVAKLGVTSLIIGHIPKGKENEDIHKTRPFGSVYWHLGARRTWFVQRDKFNTNPDKFNVEWICRKVNDGPMPRPFDTRVEFTGRKGPVRIMAAHESQNYTDAAVAFEDNPLDRIWHVLRDAPRSAEDIGQRVGLVGAAVLRLIQDNGDYFREVEGDGGQTLWARVETATG